MASIILRASRAEGGEDQIETIFVSVLLAITNAVVAVTGGMLVVAARNGVVDIHHEIGLLIVSGIAVANGLMVLSRIRSRLKQCALFRGPVFKKAIFDGTVSAFTLVLALTGIVVIALTPVAFSTGSPTSLQEVCTVLIGGLVLSAPAVLFLTPVMFLAVMAKQNS